MLTFLGALLLRSLLVAIEGLLSDLGLGCLQTFGPAELRSATGVVTSQMAKQSRGGFGVDEFRFAKHLSAKFRERRIVLDQFGTCIHMIVIVVGLAVVVEPRLHAFGKILVVVHARVHTLPKACGHCRCVSLLQAFVERLINIHQAPQMDVMREFVN